MARRIAALAGSVLLALAAPAQAAPEKTECLVGAKPGGGFDLTCRLVANSLLATKLIDRPMQVTYMEGGVGAVAINHVVGTRPADPGLVVAASTGSAVLISQGKFGKHDENAVRWVGSVGTDYGVIAVAANSPFKSLKELVDAYAKTPNDYPVGGGGAVGSQDWMKASLVAKAAGVDPRKMRYVALEGGGALQTNLQGGFIKFAGGDAGEMSVQHAAGNIRVLAVMSESRLSGALANVPTAREAGVDVVWPIWRGLYVGPKVSDADYAWWVEALQKVSATPEFAKEQETRGLFPFTKFGAEFDSFVKADIARFKTLSKEAGL